MDNQTTPNPLKGIAIVGMAGRFPGAKGIDQFWQNLCEGVESISFFTDEELVAAGADSALLNDSSYVKAGAVLDDIERFDARFFGFSAREAEMMDPQHRLFLECAWEALEDAGYDPETEPGLIGVYAGGNLSSYLLNNLTAAHEPLKSMVGETVLIGNDKDYIATRVSYKLNLQGPSFNVSTACSTSLVAVHLACRGLLSYECDAALAGGIAIQVPQASGYLYQLGGFSSPDGHCRAFDADARGTIFGNGVGIVVLKRLEDALADGDYIHAVIKGSAINNDGSSKVGYTAPSVEGQAEAIAESQAIAGFNPETITYIEAHGTGTALGDPIEIAALTQVFRASTQKNDFCGIGSVKTNVGHLNSASGVTGLIKTVLALKHKQIPPSLHFEAPNPEIDFANSPFYVNTKLTPWQTNGTPRRAGVSSFGVGGTNAHVVLEEAPPVEVSGPSRPWQLLLLSAKTHSALETATENLVHHLDDELNLADVAYTLNVGRRAFNHRRFVVSQGIETAQSALRSLKPDWVGTHLQTPGERPVVFMFSGQGAQYVNMAQALYQSEATFAKQVDICCELLKPHLGVDLRQVLYPDPEQLASASEQLQQTALAQPALFVIEYALAQLWQEWGVCPKAMMGHSIGEYVAATLAGVWSLDDALALVAARGKLMQRLPSGSMLAVPLSEEEVMPLLGQELSLAVINGPTSCVMSGATEAIEALESQLASQGIEGRRLHTSHAFHSSMMEPILESFTQKVKQVQLSAPQIPYLSNVTGTWITAEEATSPAYWARHLRQPVRWASGLDVLMEDPSQILVEIGPGRTLTTLAKRHPEQVPKQVVLSCIRHPQETVSDVAFLLKTVGQLWLAGVDVDWSGFYAHERRHRLPLPTYPFERQRYWVEATKAAARGQLPSTFNLWQSLVQAGQHQADVGTSDFDAEGYLENQASLESLCLAYMNLGLRQLGVFESPIQRYSLEAILEKCQIVPHYRQLVSRWLQVLVEQGHLQITRDLFSHLAPCSADSVKVLLEKVKSKWADRPKIVDLVQNCGENLVSVLLGEQEPLKFFQDLIYDFDEAEDVNQQFPLNAYYNSILQAIAKQAVDALPPLTHLRVLEVGGGQGLATRALLPVLPSERTQYTFTDIGASFLNSGKKKFSAYPFIDYRLLDIEQPPTEQGYAEHSFDVVIAVNVLHVTQNIGATLQHIRSLLAPDGLLLICELTQASPYFDTTWGLLMNPVADEGRSQGNPFLSRQQWRVALLERGFVEVEAFPVADTLGQHILMAQATASTALPTPAAFIQTLEQKDTEQPPQVPGGKKPDITDWFYVPSWKRSALPPTIQATQPSCWLMFIDECGLSAKILKRLELEGHDVIAVKIGEKFRNPGSPAETPKEYTINPQCKEDYDALLRELIDLNWVPTKIAHLWNVTPPSYTALGLDTITLAQEKGLYSLLFLVQALGQQNLTSDSDLQIDVISSHLQSVTGEEKLSIEKAPLLGAVRVIPLEYPNLSCRSIDVLLPDDSGQAEKLAEHLCAELSVNAAEPVIAYRGMHRWLQFFEPVPLENPSEAKSRLREEGVYLITGGLGAIGLTLADYLAKAVRAKLILIGRSDFPAKDEWEQWLSNHEPETDISYKILQLQALEACGAEVLVVSADVANLEQMQQVVAQAQEYFGPINGVIHSAGVLGDSMIVRKTREAVENTLSSKVGGTLVLDNIFQDAELDFMVLCSSLASIKPLFGQISYSSANNFLDAFAHHRNTTKGGLTVSINWDGWQAGGMGVEGVKRLEQALALPKLQRKDVTHPLFEECLVEGQAQAIYVSKLQVNQNWVLDEHRLMEQATLPGTAYLEMVRAAGADYTQQTLLEIREIYFLKPLIVEESEEKEVRTILQDQGEIVEFVVMSQSPSESKGWIEHARGKIANLKSEYVEPVSIDDLEAKCNQQIITFSKQQLQIPPEVLKLGERWNNLQWIKQGKNQALACLELPEAYANDLNLYQLHPALLDMATAFFNLGFQEETSVYLPFCYKRLQVRGELPQRVYSYIQVLEGSEVSGETLKFNITIFNEAGRKLVESEEYTLRRINPGNVDRGKADKASADQRTTQKLSVPSENYTLNISRPGRLHTLRFQPTERMHPGLGEVEIEVAATGLNFMEVLVALGLLPIPADMAFSFGLECAGRVSALGEGVEDFEVGDEVIALGTACFSRFMTTSAQLVAPKPDHLSLEEAATIPIAFVTAYIALMHFGRLQSGEKVLIHSAAGGVGMAAVQIAQWVGADIFATAGTPEKREFLHSLGIKHVMDSRSLAFADEVMGLTEGAGVDVVLNSLGGEFISKSLSVLGRYGRFLELGLRDIVNDTPLGLGVFEKRLSFFAIHAEPELPGFSAFWQEVVQHFQQQNFRPMPHKVFPLGEASNAFEYMSQGKHIGKIVLSFEDKAALEQVLMAQAEETEDTAEPGAFAIPFSAVSSGVGAEGRARQPAAATANTLPVDIRADWLSPSEGIDVFERIMAGSRFAQVLVSTSNFLTRGEPNSPYEMLSLKHVENASQSMQATHARPELENAYVAPKNEIEQVLAQVWQEVLGIKQIGIHDNFFDLGGDSLLATQVVSKLEKFPINLPSYLLETAVVEIFNYSTIQSFARYLSQEQTPEAPVEEGSERAKSRNARQGLREKQKQSRQKHRLKNKS
ncbi:MAG: SDR family NAD(P)-dependent oxidoreductase [Cyanobacteria bacterium P01_A01_bin.123]